MSTKTPPRDPIAAYQRQATAARRVGANARCACGEERPQALITGSRPVICIECNRTRKGQKTMDKHHPAGKSNSPVTVSIPANDHRARLSEDQCDWPKQTLENPDGSPLRTAAGCIRGCIDTVTYLIETLLEWIADMLERLDTHLHDRLGPKWWVNTPVEQAAPKGWANAYS
jgi:hypothetical protein